MFPSGWIWSHLPPPTSHCAPRCIPIAKNPWCFSTLSVFFPNGFPHEIPRNPTEFDWNPIEIPLKSHSIPLKSHDSPFVSPLSVRNSPCPRSVRPASHRFRSAKSPAVPLGSWADFMGFSVSMFNGDLGISNISMMRIWVNHNNSLSHGKSPFDS
jgi:hypothetical protein